MTEDRFLTAREHGSEPTPFASEESMPHGVHALMQEVEASSRQPVLNRILPEARFEQLPPPDDPILLRRHLRNQGVGASIVATSSARPRQTAI